MKCLWGHLYIHLPCNLTMCVFQVVCVCVCLIDSKDKKRFPTLCTLSSGVIAVTVLYFAMGFRSSWFTECQLFTNVPTGCWLRLSRNFSPSPFFTAYSCGWATSGRWSTPGLARILPNASWVSENRPFHLFSYLGTPAQLPMVKMAFHIK